MQTQTFLEIEEPGLLLGMEVWGMKGVSQELMEPRAMEEKAVTLLLVGWVGTEALLVIMESRGNRRVVEAAAGGTDTGLEERGRGGRSP